MLKIMTILKLSSFLIISNGLIPIMLACDKKTQIKSLSANDLVNALEFVGVHESGTFKVATNSKITYKFSKIDVNDDQGIKTTQIKVLTKLKNTQIIYVIALPKKDYVWKNDNIKGWTKISKTNAFKKRFVVSGLEAKAIQVPNLPNSLTFESTIDLDDAAKIALKFAKNSKFTSSSFASSRETTLDESWKTGDLVWVGLKVKPHYKLPASLPSGWEIIDGSKIIQKQFRIKVLPPIVMPRPTKPIIAGKYDSETNKITFRVTNLKQFSIKINLGNRKITKESELATIGETVAYGPNVNAKLSVIVYLILKERRQKWPEVADGESLWNLGGVWEKLKIPIGKEVKTIRIEVSGISLKKSDWIS